MTLADLEGYESSFKDAVNVTLRNGNFTIYNPPPPSSGVVLDFILGILDGKHSITIFLQIRVEEVRVPELLCVY